ncbi:MAG TPA: ABC transporter ATP-binding protein, partial [bacterium]
DGGVTVLLVEQNVRQALEIAHRGYVLETGRTIQSGPAADLLQDPEIKRAFLGM